MPLILIFFLVIVSCAASAQQPERLALVVGATEYGQDREAREAAGFIVPSRLFNAGRDAELVGDALKTAGFEVERLNDPSKRQLLAAINGMSRRLRDAGDDAVGIFYFAGHGAQGRPPLERDVDNYLIPIGADLQTEIDLEAEAVGLSRVSATLSGAAAKAVVIILDACRNFALPRADRAGSTSRGLVEARAKPRTMVAYATAPGDLADDGRPGGNGPYADALARAIREARGARLEDVFYQVRQDVLGATNGDQQPWENSSLIEPVVLGTPEAVAEPPALPRADPYGGRDAVVFGVIKDSRIASDFEAFLSDYPESALASYARTRLAMLTEGAIGPPPASEPTQPDPVVEPEPEVRPTEPPALAPDTLERELTLSRDDRRLVQLALNEFGQDAGVVDGLFGPRTRSALANWQRSKGHRATGYLDAEQMAFLVQHGRLVESLLKERRPAEPAVGIYGLDPPYKPGDVFKDCPECPEMVVVPAGTFMMGAPPDEQGFAREEGPQHRVTISAPFAVSKYEITFEQWDACLESGGCSGYRPDDRGWGRGLQPVINVSWNDTQSYLSWLREETGEHYRLLSEAEWEYVARAGTITPFNTGDILTPEQANFASGSAQDRRPMPVGHFSPNAFGLHDVHGNVWEWVEDCWPARGSRRAPQDGVAWTEGECARRVLRGGGWDNTLEKLRSALRGRTEAHRRISKFGFRVARQLH